MIPSPSAPERDSAPPVCAAAPVDAGRRVRPALLAAAGAVWLWTTFSHDLGTRLAHAYYQWARVAGALDAEGGGRGVLVAERILTAGFLLVVAAGVWAAVRGARGLGPEERRDRVLAWLLWAASVHLLWKACIVFATEFVHFAQYGVVGALLCAGLGRTRAQLAFVVATLLGMLDEAWQHWGLAEWIQGIAWHGFDWSDVILNAAGACGGALALRRPDPARDASSRTAVRAAGGLALVLLPLLLLGRARLSELLGSTTYHPTWNEYDIGKPAHWMTPVDGIPLVVASVLFLGEFVLGVRAAAVRGAALALLVLATLAIDPPSRLAGRPVHEPVPETTARRASGPVVVDGRLDEPAWARADRIGPFGFAVPPRDASARPSAATWARVLWDDRALYVAFEARDPDVWGRDVGRDHPRLPGDEVVEVFVDPDGDEVTYYEFEFSPVGAVFDLFNLIPESPADFNPSARFVGLAAWDARGMQHAVTVDGTADRVPDWDPAGPIDEDRGFTVEVAIPWDVFRTTTTPAPDGRVHLPPHPGDRWRLGLFRVERPRRRPDGTPLSRDEGDPFAEFQAWSPSLRASFHRPERFGVLRFAE